MLSITFLMPGRGVSPVGGFKVVFEYANRLSYDGFDVHIVYPVSINFRNLGFTNKIKSVLRFPYWILNGFSGKKWFSLNEKIKHHLVLSLNQRHVPKTDYYVATARATSVYLKDYNIADDNKLYLIQGFEDWGVPEEEVYKTYRFGLRNIVISNWLKDRVEKAGASCILIKNGFDFDYFKLNNQIGIRSPYVVSMLYHHSTRKGCKYGVEALSIVKSKYPQLKALFFGTPERPDDLPEWVEYYRCPDKETHNYIYNTSSIYLAPSLQEGWGLTVGEAMICGNAIVCTDTLGFQEMVKDGENGFIVPVANSEALAEKIVRLIENDNLRWQMANNAYETIKAFSWENSYKIFRGLFN